MPDAAVLHHVEAPEPATPRLRRQSRDQLVGIESRSVEADRNAGLEADDHLGRLGLGDPGEGVHVVGRRSPWVLDGAALDRLAPRLSSMEYGFSFVTVIGISHFAAKSTQSSRLSPRRARRVDGEIRSQRPDADLEADLVVPLARAAVSDGCCAMAPRLSAPGARR